MQTQHTETARAESVQGLDMALDMGTAIGPGHSPGMAFATPPDCNLGKHQAAANASPQVQQLKATQAAANGKPQVKTAMTENAGMPIQRQQEHYTTQPSEPDLVKQFQDAVLGAVQTIDQEMEFCRGQALNWRDYIGHGEKHLSNWALVANQYANDPEKVPTILHARFGYAVETLTCMRVKDRDFGGLRPKFQVGHGHTRPDIVLCRQDGKEIAWIDLTSWNSRGHILGKDGAGWKTRPFVVELLYAPLDPSEVLGESDAISSDIARYIAQKNQIRFEEESGNKLKIQNTLIALQEQYGFETGVVNALEKRRATRDTLKQELGMNLGNSMEGAHAALEMVGVNSGPFGFNCGDVGQDSTIPKDWVAQASAPAIAQRNDNLLESEIIRLGIQLGENETHPLSRLFFSSPLQGEKLLFLGIALSRAIEMEAMLTNYLEELGSQFPNSPHAAHVRTVLAGHLKVISNGELDSQADAQGWFSESNRLIAEIRAEEQTLRTDELEHNQEHTMLNGLNEYLGESQEQKQFNDFAFMQQIPLGDNFQSEHWNYSDQFES